MIAFLAFLMRNWQAVAGIVTAAVLAILLAIRTDQRDDLRAALDRERQAQILFAERVRATSEGIARRAAELARRVEASQSRISQEASDDYQTRLARLRADFDSRLRAEAARRAGAGGGGDAVSGLPDPAGGPDGAAAPAGPAAFEFACRANTIQLEGLQDWVRRQGAVER